MNYPRRQSKRLYREGVPGRRAAGQGNPGELLCHVARSLRFYGNGVSFQVVSGQSSCLAHSLTQGPPRWCVHLSAEMDSSVTLSGRSARHIVSSLLLSAPLEFSWLVLSSSTVFFIGTSCCETAQASDYHHAWPRRAVSVNGSLTVVLGSVTTCKRYLWNLEMNPHPQELAHWIHRKCKIVRNKLNIQCLGYNCS